MMISLESIAGRECEVEVAIDVVEVEGARQLAGNIQVARSPHANIHLVEKHQIGAAELGVLGQGRNDTGESLSALDVPCDRANVPSLGGWTFGQRPLKSTEYTFYFGLQTPIKGVTFQRAPTCDAREVIEFGAQVMIKLSSR